MFIFVKNAKTWGPKEHLYDLQKDIAQITEINNKIINNKKKHEILMLFKRNSINEYYN